MELLNVLEKKVMSLVDMMRQLQQENIALVQERMKLREQIEAFEHSMLRREQSAEERSQELAQAKVMVDELIKSIDLVFEQQVPKSHELHSS